MTNDSQDLDRLVAELADEVRGRFFGKYRGVVDEVDDQQGMGLITARVPSVYGDQPSPWALPCVPFAGPGHGLALLPEHGDGVWIEFEGGDPSHPIWTGCWWAQDELPDPGGPQQRVLVTTGKLKLVLDDKARQIQLLHPDGAKLTLSKQNITIQIGRTKLVLSSHGVVINDGAFEVT